MGTGRLINYPNFTGIKSIRFFGGGIVLIGLLTLLGWVSGIRELASIQIKYIPMSPDTGMEFICFGLILLFWNNFNYKKPTKFLITFVIIFCSVYGFLKAFEYFIHLDLTFENILFPITEKLGSFPLKRMSPFSGLLFFFYGISLLLILFYGDRSKILDGTSFVGFLIAISGFIAVLGYLYGTPILYGGDIIPMAPNTAGAFMLIGSSLILISGPGTLILSHLTGPTAEARLLRVILPINILGILTEGLLGDFIPKYFKINQALFLAVSTLVFIVITTVFVYRYARIIFGSLNEAEIKRKKAEEIIIQLNESLEKRVVDRTHQLELAIKELESFSYSISHDLRTPLRALNGYSHILMEEYHPQLDQKARNYLERIHSASQRLSQLTDDMIQLSLVVRKEIEISEMNLSVAAQEIIDVLNKENRDQNITTIIQPGMVVLADSKLMQIALENLLKNAWKFTRKQSEGKIEFGSHDLNGKTIFFIKDNGSGFDMAFYDKLFTPFQRLHSNNEFEGTGIGLAIVQRVIQKHQGTVWAKSELGKGAIFYFTLPEKQMK